MLFDAGTIDNVSILWGKNNLKYKTTSNIKVGEETAMVSDTLKRISRAVP